MKKRINVTRRDIEQGQPRHNFLCPIARAMKRALGAQHVGAHVDGAYVRLESGATRRIDIPVRARRFMVAFDRDDPVEPIRFTITY